MVRQLPLTICSFTTFPPTLTVRNLCIHSQGTNSSYNTKQTKEKHKAVPRRLLATLSDSILCNPSVRAQVPSATVRLAYEIDANSSNIALGEGIILEADTQMSLLSCSAPRSKQDLTTNTSSYADKYALTEKRRRRHDFPTPESPINTNLKR